MHNIWIVLESRLEYNQSVCDDFVWLGKQVAVVGFEELDFGREPRLFVIFVVVVDRIVGGLFALAEDVQDQFEDFQNVVIVGIDLLQNVGGVLQEQTLCHRGNYVIYNSIPTTINS